MQTRNKAADNIVMSQISPRKLDIKETPSDATLRDQTLEPAHSKKNLGSLGYQESHRPQRGKAQFLEPQRWTALEINTLVENDKNLSTWQNSSRYEDTTHSSSRTSFKSGSESHNKPRNESRIYGAPEWLNGFSPLDDDDGESHNSATPSCLGHSHTGGRMIRLHEPISASPDTSTTELPASSISEDAEDIGDLEKFWPRTLWLILLLIIQSLVSIILQHYQGMIQHHPVVVYFLTMLIGSGGNAGITSFLVALIYHSLPSTGSQSTVLVIRGLAVGKYKRKDYVNVIFEQCRTGYHAKNSSILVIYILIMKNVIDVLFKSIVRWL